MKKKIYVIVKFILCLPYYIVKCIVRLTLNIYRSFKFASEKSYYPESNRKSFLRRFLDNIIFSLKYGCPCYFYTLYGLDLRGANMKDYVMECEFWKKSDYLNGLIKGNHQACRPGSQLFYLRDKYSFYHFMKNHNLPVPDVFALMINGIFYDYDFNKISNITILKSKDYFIKDYNGQCASFVKHIKSCQDLSKYNNLGKGIYILQKTVHQADFLNQINSNSLNTLRIVTINNNGNPYVFSSILRVGTEKTENVDNWAAGGLAIGVNDDGTLKEYGFFKPQYGLKVNKHPDTNFVFKNFKLKDFDIACQLACRAHKYLFDVYSIGWDIALTNDGPVFIEGNDNWEISLMQACNGGLRKEWEEAISIGEK